MSKPKFVNDVDQVRHSTRCLVCAHPDREEIEKAFIDWTSGARIVEAFSIPGDGQTVYRHARAFGLYEKRDRNVKHALGKIVERASEVMPNANAIVAAAVALAKINADGRYVERRELLNLTPIFERLSAQELEEYASTGALPPWAQVEVKAGA